MKKSQAISDLLYGEVSKLERSSRPITEYEHLIPNLTHLLGYRVKVAELLLSDLDLDTRNNLKESYNQVNKKIKDLLAL